MDDLHLAFIIGDPAIDIQIVKAFHVCPSELHPERIDHLGHIRDFRIFCHPVILYAQGWIDEDEFLDLLGIVAGIKGRDHATLAYAKQGNLPLLYSFDFFEHIDDCRKVCLLRED